MKSPWDLPKFFQIFYRKQLTAGEKYSKIIKSQKEVTVYARVAQWWSIALPRRGSRVRIPSRAFGNTVVFPGDIFKYKIMHEWLSGGVSPCQGEGRGFESRLVLFEKGAETLEDQCFCFFLFLGETIHKSITHPFSTRHLQNRAFSAPPLLTQLFLLINGRSLSGNR